MDKNPNAVDVHGDCPGSLRWRAWKAGITLKFGKIPQDMVDAIQSIMLEMIVEYAQIEFFATSDPQGFSVTLYLMRISIEYDPEEDTSIPKLDQQFKVVLAYTWFLEQERKQRQLQVGRPAPLLPEPPNPTLGPARRRSRHRDPTKRGWQDPDTRPGEHSSVADLIEPLGSDGFEYPSDLEENFGLF